MRDVTEKEEEPQDEFLSPANVALMLDVSTMTVYRLCNRGELPHVRVGKQIRVRLSDLANYLEQDLLG